MPTTSTLTEGEAAAAVAGGLLGTFFTFAIIFYIITVIAGWKIFEKAGEKGWKALIPIYNYYVLYKIVGMQNAWWGMLVLSLVCSIIFSLNGFSTSMTAEQIQAYDFGGHIWVVLGLIVLGIAGLVVDILHTVRLAHAFKKGIGFIIAMILFPNICWLILGLGKSKFDKKLALAD